VRDIAEKVQTAMLEADQPLVTVTSLADQTFHDEDVVLHLELSSQGRNVSSEDRS
jgi:hypothetical protein